MESEKCLLPLSHTQLLCASWSVCSVCVCVWFVVCGPPPRRSPKSCGGQRKIRGRRVSIKQEPKSIDVDETAQPVQRHVKRMAERGMPAATRPQRAAYRGGGGRGGRSRASITGCAGGRESLTGHTRSLERRAACRSARLANDARWVLHNPRRPSPPLESSGFEGGRSAPVKGKAPCSFFLRATELASCCVFVLSCIATSHVAGAADVACRRKKRRVVLAMRRTCVHTHTQALRRQRACFHDSAGA